MTKLEVRGEFDPLCRADVRIGHEDHVRHRSARKYNTTEKLTDQVKAAVLIRDSHDDTHWDEKNTGNSKGQKKPVPGQVRWVAFIAKVSHCQKSENGGHTIRL